ncbi:hypothetical protein JCM14202_2253 [Agrilactobacillus composti DSM 18527 = JCM 14202]|nr:hypothetical protein [Agrilactobacillus composti]GAF40357.1 hypothetical protein JCM14202_2253 [Agrilactobacillus composti DSM 18527 = JCM 14202]
MKDTINKFLSDEIYWLAALDLSIALVIVIPAFITMRFWTMFPLLLVSLLLAPLLAWPFRQIDQRAKQRTTITIVAWTIMIILWLVGLIFAADKFKIVVSILAVTGSSWGLYRSKQKQNSK